MNERHQFEDAATEVQKEFFALPEDFRTALIEYAHDNANTVRDLVTSGQAATYEEAVGKLPSAIPEQGKTELILETVDHGRVRVTTESNGDFMLHIADAAPQLLGNAYEGVFKEIFGTVQMDTGRLDSNLEQILSTIDLLEHAGGTA
jgi:hypothetical protein